MNKTYGHVLLIASFLVLCSLAVKAEETIGCKIETKASGPFVKLSAVIFSRAPARGTYEFKVLSKSSGGKSSADQRGSFEIKGKEKHKQLVSYTVISMGPYDALMTVKANGKTVSCKKQVEDIETPKEI